MEVRQSSSSRRSVNSSFDWQQTASFGLQAVHFSHLQQWFFLRKVLGVWNRSYVRVSCPGKRHCKVIVIVITVTVIIRRDVCWLISVVLNCIFNFIIWQVHQQTKQYWVLTYHHINSVENQLELLCNKTYQKPWKNVHNKQMYMMNIRA